jgi:hypothetical protein
MSAISIYVSNVFENMKFYELREANFHKDLVEERIKEKERQEIFDLRFPLTLEERKYLIKRRRE